MIRYALRCDRGHDFQSWFRDSETFDRLSAAGEVACVLCGSSSVEKALMAPKVAQGGGAGQAEAAPGEGEGRVALSTPGSELERKLAALRAHIERTSDYVGRDFAREARSIHEGESGRRAIHGEATRAEARSLIEDGVPVAPIPFLPRRNA